MKTLDMIIRGLTTHILLLAGILFSQPVCFAENSKLIPDQKSGGTAFTLNIFEERSQNAQILVNAKNNLLAANNPASQVTKLPDLNYRIEYDRLGNAQYTSAIYYVDIVKNADRIGVFQTVVANTGGSHPFQYYVDLTTHDVTVTGYGGPVTFTRGTDHWKTLVQSMRDNAKLARDHAVNGQQKKHIKTIIKFLDHLLDTYQAPPSSRFTRPIDEIQRPLVRASR